ncbi:hypothetical protein [Clostridium estertheticum]|nr:hypothetical protein [Clostridium estertheticum]
MIQLNFWIIGQSSFVNITQLSYINIVAMPTVMKSSSFLLSTRG